MKTFNQMQLDSIDKNYKEHRGSLVKKYRTIFGKYVFIMDKNGEKSRVYVGKCIYENTELGSKLTIGEIKHKLSNIRTGICKSNDE